jgi:IclR family transcriptional regulator, KDG regulon repressor
MRYKPRKLQSDSYSIQSIDRAFQILTCFSFERPQLTLGELNDLLDLSKTTLYRILQALGRNRVIAYDPVSNRYSLGMRLFELGEVAVSSTSLRQKAAPFLEALEAEGRYPCMLGILEDGELVYIDGRPGMNQVPLFGTRHGKKQMPHLGSIGRLLMSYLTDGEVDHLLSLHPLQAFTSRSILNREKFKKSLREIRKRGYAADEGELVEGVIGLAAPIRDHSRKVIAAIGTVFPAFQVDSEKKDQLTALVLRSSRGVSEAMGYVAPVGERAK